MYMFVYNVHVGMLRVFDHQRVDVLLRKLSRLHFFLWAIPPLDHWDIAGDLWRPLASGSGGPDAHVTLLRTFFDHTACVQGRTCFDGRYLVPRLIFKFQPSYLYPFGLSDTSVIAKH